MQCLKGDTWHESIDKLLKKREAVDDDRVEFWYFDTCAVVRCCRKYLRKWAARSAAKCGNTTKDVGRGFFLVWCDTACEIKVLGMLGLYYWNPCTTQIWNALLQNLICNISVWAQVWKWDELMKLARTGRGNWSCSQKAAIRGKYLHTD